MFVGADVASELKKCFAGLWSLDDISDHATQQVIKQAIASPGDFIMKPQREGGGNNLYGPHPCFGKQMPVAVHVLLMTLALKGIGHDV